MGNSFSPDSTAKLSKILVQDEGLRLHPYKDTQNNLTIGIGRNLDAKGISKDEADYLFQNDIQDCMQELQSLSVWSILNDDRKIVLVAMCFNLGLPRLMQFRRLFGALEKEDYVQASKEILDSDAARQLPARYERYAYFMEIGTIGDVK